MMTDEKKGNYINRRLVALMTPLVVFASLTPILGGVMVDHTTVRQTIPMNKENQRTTSVIHLYFSTSNDPNNPPDVGSPSYQNPVVPSGTTLYLWAKTTKTGTTWDNYNGMYLGMNNVNTGVVYTPYIWDSVHHVYLGTRWQLVDGNPYPPIFSGDYNFSDGNCGAIAVEYPAQGLGGWAADPLRAPVSPTDTQIFLVGQVVVSGPVGTEIYMRNNGITKWGGGTVAIWFGKGDENWTCDPRPCPDINPVPDATICASPVIPGDVNGDFLVNPFDIDPFIYALTYTEAEFQAHYPTGQYWAADCNQDGLVNAFDIDPFIVLLTGK